MSIDLGSRLDDHFARAARTAPPSTIRLVDVHERVAARRRRRSARRGVAAAMTTVGLVGAIYAVRDTRSAEPAATSSSAAVTESPLVATTATMPPSAIVKPGAVTFRLSSGKHVTFAITGTEYWDGYAQEATIRFDRYAVGRIYDDAGDIDPITVPEIGGNDDMVYWTGVPAAAARVELRSGDGSVQWQTPIDGIAAFPITTHDPADVLVAVDAAGNEIGRAAWSDTALISAGETDGVTNKVWSSNTSFDTGHTDMASQFSTLDQDEEDQYRAFANNTMRQCLSENGPSAWTRCIESTDLAVESYVNDLLSSRATND